MLRFGGIEGYIHAHSHAGLHDSEQSMLTIDQCAIGGNGNTLMCCIPVSFLHVFRHLLDFGVVDVPVIVVFFEPLFSLFGRDFVAVLRFLVEVIASHL